MKVKALYTVPELAEMAGMDEQRMRRWIARAQLSVVRSGRAVMVPLPAFRDAFPQVWEAIKLQRGLKAGNCEACGGQVRP